jgi:hypothetical protein
MIYLIKKIIGPKDTKTKINITIMDKEEPIFDNINIFYYANMLSSSKYYYYILEKNNNTYKIGDEIQEKSSNKRLYVILNKLELQDNVLFQIIESTYMNTVNILDFHNNVKIINLIIITIKIDNFDNWILVLSNMSVKLKRWRCR